MNIESVKDSNNFDDIFESEAEDAEAKLIEIKIVNAEDDIGGIPEMGEVEIHEEKPRINEKNEIQLKETQSEYINMKRLRPRQLKNVLETDDKLSSTKRAKGELNCNKSNTSSKLKSKWSKKDKRTLLEALKKYGRNNLNAISEMLPDIPLELIKERIFIYEVLAEYYYEDDLINKWMKCGICRPGDSCISEALLFIKLLEHHPSSSESKFDYREIYNFLHHAFSEEKQPFPELKEQNRDMLLSLISKVDANMYPKLQKQLWDYLGKVYPKRHIRHVYPGKKYHYDVQ